MAFAYFLYGINNKNNYVCVNKQINKQIISIITIVVYLLLRFSLVPSKCRLPPFLSRDL